MKSLRYALALACLTTSGLVLNAAVLPAEQLLPSDTLAFVTIPDWQKQTVSYNASAMGQLWKDPSMKAFTDKFAANFAKDFLGPLEKELGVKFADYKELLQGQITVAMLPTENKKEHAVALLIDTKEKQELLKTRLAELKKRWTDSGKQVKTEKVRDVEFTSITYTAQEMQVIFKKAFPQAASALEATPEEGEDKQAAEAEAKKPQTLVLGQTGSLLMIGRDTKSLEKILSRATGGIVPPLAEQAAFQKDARLLRDAVIFGWVNWQPVYSQIVASLSEDEADPDEPQMFSTEQLLKSLGFASLNALTFAVNYGSNGMSGEVNLAAPEGSRQGIVKLLAPESKDASPPPFVTADTAKFARWRISLPKAWDQVEATIKQVSPQAAGVLNLVLGTLGKDKDPNFDFKKSLIGNLGDDVITLEKAPRTMTLEGLNEPPTLTMVSSPNPEVLASALTSLGSMLGPTESGSSPFKEREFLGKKIYAITMPHPEDPEKTRTLSYAATGGYVVFSSDVALLETHLRAAENQGKPLRELPGLQEATEKVGGMNTGVFGFENQVESARAFVETVKKDPRAAETAFYLNAGELGEANTLTNWFDFALLPNFDQISKYFHISVYSFGSNADGLVFKAHAPTPPQLKK